MQKGAVKFFNVSKGFGFIKPSDGGPDVFVHINDLRKSGMETLAQDQAVQFESGPGRDGKPRAVKVELV